LSAFWKWASPVSSSWGNAETFWPDRTSSASLSEANVQTCNWQNSGLLWQCWVFQRAAIPKKSLWTVDYTDHLNTEQLKFRHSGFFYG
jgi:hypothetical protein